jgi:cytochrome c oxidase subunit 2
VRRRTRLAILPALLAVVGLTVFAPAAGALPLAPETPHSPNADDMRTAYWAVVIVATVLAVAINAALIAVIVRFRASRGRAPAQVRGGRRIQVRVGTLLAAIALAVFVFGVIFTVKARDVPPSGPEGLQASSLRTAQVGLAPPAGDQAPLDITVSGQQWLWRYEYPDGSFSYYEMVVPVDTTVVLHIDSTDVVHRWWIPALGGKFDAVPGRLNETWFRADEEGIYDGQSAAFSGPGYPTMRARVRVVSVPDYQAWLDDQGAAIQAAQEAIQRGPVEGASATGSTGGGA